MASSTVEDVRAYWHKKAKWLIPYISTQSAVGDTTYMVDTVNFTDTSNVLLSTETLNGKWIFQPDDAVAGDRERMIGGNSGSALVTTTGRVYPTVAWANAPQSAEQYEITKLRPKLMFDLLVDTLEGFYMPAYNRVSMFTDSDMQVSGTTNWTLSGAGSLSKVVTSATNEVGAQSLFFSAGTAGENVKSVTIRVVPGQTYEAYVTLRVDVGGPAAFVVYDETNSGEISSTERVYSTVERWVTMKRTFRTTAHVVNSSGVVTTQGTEEITLRVYCTGNTDRIYISGFSGPRKDSDTIFGAPSTMENSKYLRRLQYATYLTQIANGVYDAESRQLIDIPSHHWHMNVAHHYVNPYRIQVREGYQLPSGELWLERLQKASELTTLVWTAAGETSPTIPLPKDLIGLASLKTICEHILSYAPTDTEALSTYRQLNDPRGELASLMRDYMQDIETPQYAPHPRTWSLTAL